MCLGGECSEERLSEILEEAGLSSDEQKGLSERPLGEGSTSISGGQKKRLGIARMLYHGAQVMIFDEPTAELDEDNATLVIAALIRLSRRMSIIVVSHDERLIESVS